jgi:HK97 family phage prohead protease
MAADTKKPYGDVKYADPGYQEDGKARYPLDTEDHCRAAWSYINMPKNAEKYTAEQLSQIKGRIKAAGKRLGIEFNDETKRSDPVPYARSWALDDIHILRAADGHGDGRTVEAYAAVFDVETEITDQHGHYMEKIDRRAFNRTLQHGIDRVGVFYNHALTMHGTPASGEGSVPIGSPVSIRADAKGLRTVTRFNRSAMADAVLEAIRNGDIKGYSFRGRIFRSNPARVPKVSRGGRLPVVTRTELGLAEYGPTPIPAYQEASILAMRNLFDELRGDLRGEFAEIARAIAPSTPQDPDDAPATPDPGPGAEDPPDVHSSRQQQLLRLRMAMRERGMR